MPPTPNVRGAGAVIVGGGIAGLATAAALRRVGLEVCVLEQAEAFGEVGAGISLWANALAALDALGLGDAVREAGTPETLGGVRERTGRWLARTDHLRSRFERGVLIRRAELIDILRGALPASALKVRAEVSAIRQDAEGVTADHEGGQARGDLLVGADGIHSVVRGAILPGARPPRYAGYTTWRFISRPIQRRLTMTESWGRGERVGGGQFRDGSVYCYLAASVPEGGRGDERAELCRRFGDWHDPIPQLLDAAPPSEDILRYDIYDLPPLPTFVSGRVALVGDAAHAMTPDLGQGGCQALEDAVSLAACLAEHASLEGALSAYGRLRRPRTQAIVRNSRLVARLGQAAHPLIAGLRDGITRALPARVAAQMLEAPWDWRAPTLTGSR